MQKIIKGMLYDAENSRFVAQRRVEPCYENDFEAMFEYLHKTPNGNYFLSNDSKILRALTPEEACEWLEANDCIAERTKEFGPPQAA